MLNKLNKKELQILEAMSEGLSNKAIAEKLTLNIRSLLTMTHRIYDKLGLIDRDFRTTPRVKAAKLYWEYTHGR